MGRPSRSTRPAVYIALRPVCGAKTVLGSFVSSPGDVHRDAPRLYGEPVEWVSWSKANRFTRAKATQTDRQSRTEPER